MNQTVSIQLPIDVVLLLEEEARRRMTTKSSLIRGVLAEHLEKVGLRPNSRPPIPGAQHEAEEVTP